MLKKIFIRKYDGIWCGRGIQRVILYIIKETVFLYNFFIKYYNSIYSIYIVYIYIIVVDPVEVEQQWQSEAAGPENENHVWSPSELSVAALGLCSRHVMVDMEQTPNLRQAGL